MTARTGELAVKGQLGRVEQDFTAPRGVRLRSAERDVAQHFEIDRVDDRERVGEIVADHQRLAVAGETEAAGIGLRGKTGANEATNSALIEGRPVNALHCRGKGPGDQE